MTARGWVFTLNNYTDDDLIKITEIPARYIITGKEIGKSGTPHIQGYLEMKSPIRLSACKKYLPTAHFEQRRGTREQARNYCQKENNWTEIGDWEAGGQGTRNDIRELIRLTKERKSFTEIAEEIPTALSRNLKFYDRLNQTIERDETREFRQVEVICLIGEAGTGKSRIARELDENAFTVNPEDSFPFDGYDGEKTIIIDDFEGSLKYKHLLKILDGHQLRLNTKGSHRYAKWNRVIITSDKEPQNWYQRGLTKELNRRISYVSKFCHDERGNTDPLDI